MKTISFINYIIALLFSLCFSYQLLYLVVPLFKKNKLKKGGRLHNYGVLIAARNEETVISQLIESIKKQSYPKELINIFVVADNCTDNTASVAREAGATVWERFDKRNIGKGYALDFLLDRIGESYPENAFDGYFVFDADNLLDENYIWEMNQSFTEGNRIITSYRNSKNYGDNWISAGNSLWFLRESQYLSRSRMLLGTSCAVSGTGFLIHNQILKKYGGWKFFLLTEDIEFSISNIIDGERIAYCESAMLYDEQPRKFSQSWTQRMRWAKGNLQVCQKYGVNLIKSIFKNRSFASYDMAITIFPATILAALSSAINLFGMAYGIVSKDSIVILISSIMESIMSAYLLFFVMGFITTITEWKKICSSAFKKILYLFTFPFFMFTYIPIAFAVLFKRVEWKPIKHKNSITLKEVRELGS
ncbi:MAG: glycosyltransferase family 2 protein [Clostridiales bacterium]|nr:glycosyltransferase family 2 protein [Clostridiales bacterium]